MAQQCYTKTKGKVEVNAGYKFCGTTNTTNPLISCCANNDECMSNGLCHYTRSAVGGSGFYAAGCNDKAFADGSCPQLCNDLEVRDVSYEAQARRWACCGITKDGFPSCDNATRQNFDAPQPNQLRTTWIAGVGTPTSTPSPGRGDGRRGGPPDPPPPPPPPSRPPWTPMPRPTEQSGGSLTPGVAAGVGAGVAGGVLIIIGAIIACILMRRRKKKKEGVANLPPPATTSATEGSPNTIQAAYFQDPHVFHPLTRAELSNERKMQELDSKPSRQSLSTIKSYGPLPPQELPTENEIRPVTAGSSSAAAPQTPMTAHANPNSPHPNFSPGSAYPTWTSRGSDRNQPFPPFSPISPESPARNSSDAIPPPRPPNIAEAIRPKSRN